MAFGSYLHPDRDAERISNSNHTATADDLESDTRIPVMR